jgi:hypothetical protein
MPFLLLLCLPWPTSSSSRRKRKHNPLEEAATPDPPAAESHPDRRPTVLGSDVREDDPPGKKK